MEDSPFMKELVSSSPEARKTALNRLRTYLKSNTTLTALDYLMIWKALFFTMWHCDGPKAQPALSRSLADLALSLPDPSFIPFLRAFWTTMAREWTRIDALRMDKYLKLVRDYVNAGFTWLARGKWEEGRVLELMGLMREWPLSVPVGGEGEGEEQGNGEKVGDGMRYHVLDVWVDELEKVDGEDGAAPLETIMAVPGRLVKARGATKALKERARECVGDERLENWGKGGEGSGEDEEFQDFDAE